MSTCDLLHILWLLRSWLQLVVRLKYRRRYGSLRLWLKLTYVVKIVYVLCRGTQIAQYVFVSSQPKNIKSPQVYNNTMIRIHKLTSLKLCSQSQKSVLRTTQHQFSAALTKKPIGFKKWLKGWCVAAGSFHLRNILKFCWRGTIELCHSKATWKVQAIKRLKSCFQS